jgi:hypothetical protein
MRIRKVIMVSVNLILTKKRRSLRRRILETLGSLSQVRNNLISQGSAISTNRLNKRVQKNRTLVTLTRLLSLRKNLSVMGLVILMSLKLALINQEKVLKTLTQIRMTMDSVILTNRKKLALKRLLNLGSLLLTSLPRIQV